MYILQANTARMSVKKRVLNSSTVAVNIGPWQQHVRSARISKKKSGEIRDQMRSQSNQQQYATYTNAATASKGNTAMGSMGTGAGMPGLTKTETKS